MLLIAIIIGLITGSYIGKLLVQHVFNNKVSPLEPIKEVNDFEIIKSLEEQDN